VYIIYSGIRIQTPSTGHMNCAYVPRYSIYTVGDNELRDTSIFRKIKIGKSKMQKIHQLPRLYYIQSVYLASALVIRPERVVIVFSFFGRGSRSSLVAKVQ
jgi:hypothetical protein